MSGSIWIDGDGCPVRIKDMIAKAARRSAVPAFFVANRAIVAGGLISIVVDQGMDKADDHIVNESKPGDLVITSDMPLASKLVKKKCIVITHRGESVDEGNCSDRLATRDLLDSLRSFGAAPQGGGGGLSESDIRKFASALDRFCNANRRG